MATKTFRYNHIIEVSDYLSALATDKSPHTLISYKVAIVKFFDFLNIKTFEDVTAITSKNCREFQSFLKKDGLQISTINANTRPLRAMFNWFVMDESLETNPFDKVKDLKAPKKVRACMTVEEVDTLLKGCDCIEEQFMFQLTVATGMREEEITNLKLNDANGYQILINGKGSKQRVVYMNDVVFEKYQEYLVWRNNKYGTEIPYLFVSKMRRNYDTSSVRGKFKRAMVMAKFPQNKVEEYHYHTLRHTFMAKFIDDGGNMKVAQQILGHSKMETTAEIYSHVRSSAVEAAMRGMK